jgi:hypothetical protein
MLIPLNTMVMIRKGPFSERCALVTMAWPSRVRLLIELLGRQCEVIFSVDDVEVVAAASE